MSNKSYVIAVNMIPYGIKMVVKSTTDFVDAIVNEFERLVNSDHEKADGYHLVLKAKLLREDAFFNKHPKAAHVQKERWGKFCDLCVDFAALNTVLYKDFQLPSSQAMFAPSSKTVWLSLAVKHLQELMQ